MVEDTEAAEATFLAGTHFPVFSGPGGRDYTDGGFKNNPSLLGHQEAETLLPNNSCDLVLSVGMGEGPSKDCEIENGILKFVNIAVNIVTECVLENFICY